MSILIVEIVSEGIIVAADRNITGILPNGSTEQIDQRPKILKWNNDKAIIGFVGAMRISGMPIHEWMQGFIDEFTNFDSFEDLSRELCCRVERQRKIDEGNNPPTDLLIHIAGFEERENIKVPVVWYISNVHGLGKFGYTNTTKKYSSSEEFWNYFPDCKPKEIRRVLKVLSKQFKPFWFHQGVDLITFNVFQDMLKSAFKLLCQSHPDHDFPRSLKDWEKYLHMQVLMYGSYFEAFRPEGKRLVGGADVKSIPWPD
jgi:hypothetical protein